FYSELISNLFLFYFKLLYEYIENEKIVFSWEIDIARLTDEQLIRFYSNQMLDEITNSNAPTRKYLLSLLQKVELLIKLNKPEEALDNLLHFQQLGVGLGSKFYKYKAETEMQLGLFKDAENDLYQALEMESKKPNPKFTPIYKQLAFLNNH